MALKDKLRDLVKKNRKLKEQDIKGAKRAEKFTSTMKAESDRIRTERESQNLRD